MGQMPDIAGLLCPKNPGNYRGRRRYCHRRPAISGICPIYESAYKPLRFWKFGQEWLILLSQCRIAIIPAINIRNQIASSIYLEERSLI